MLEHRGLALEAGEEVLPHPQPLGLGARESQYEGQRAGAAGEPRGLGVEEEQVPRLDRLPIVEDVERCFEQSGDGLCSVNVIGKEESLDEDDSVCDHAAAEQRRHIAIRVSTGCLATCRLV